MEAFATPPNRPAATLEKLDLALGRRLASSRRKPAVKAAAKVGKLGDQEPLYALAGLIAGAGLLARRPGLVRLGLEVGVAVLAADLMKSGLKRGLTRSRPHVLMDEGRYERSFGGSTEKPLQSFPSGHVAGAMGAAAAIRRAAPRTTLPGLAACAFLGWSRMSKAAHWPLDVVAGAIVGLAAEGVTARLIAAAAPLAARFRRRVGNAVIHGDAWNRG